MSKERMDDYSRQCPIGILSNTPAMQAVGHDTLKLTAVAFYDAGELNVPSVGRVAVSDPCVLMLRNTEGGLRLAVSDPTQKLNQLTVTLSGKLGGEGCTWNPETGHTQVLIELPADGFAGSSVLRVLQQDEPYT